MKSFKIYSAILIGVGLYMKSYANETPPDSLSSITLEEIEIEASRVIRKSDMDVYHPSLSAVENSSNGLQLISQLAIPSLFVDEVMGKISASGNEVQIRINGRIASVEQVRNLQPESIKKVEWIDFTIFQSQKISVGRKTFMG